MSQTQRDVRRSQLAHRILQHAHRADWQIGQHIPEQILCEVFGLSRTPVRAALVLLKSWGAVEHRPNQGYFLSTGKTELLSLGKDAPPTPEEELYVDLIRARLAGQLDESVNQVDLIERFKRPRNLMERVLSRLEDEGLLSRNKGRGWQFLPSFDEARSWASGYQLRILLEPAAILLPQFKVNLQQLTDCRIMHEDLLVTVEAGQEPAAWIYRVDVDFHELIASFSHNAFFLQAIQQQNKLRRLLEYGSYADSERIITWCREHLEIVAALERNNLNLASQLMRQHLEKAMATAGRRFAGEKAT